MKKFFAIFLVFIIVIITTSIVVVSANTSKEYNTNTYDINGDNILDEKIMI